MTEGPGYWDVNENSAGHVHQPRHGGHWRETIRREPELLTELWVEDLTALLTEYHAQLRERAEQRATWAADLLGCIDAVAKDQDP
jgi:hypothetical protein